MSHKEIFRAWARNKPSPTTLISGMPIMKKLIKIDSLIFVKGIHLGRLIPHFLKLEKEPLDRHLALMRDVGIRLGFKLLLRQGSRFRMNTV